MFFFSNWIFGFGFAGFGVLVVARSLALERLENLSGST